MRILIIEDDNILRNNIVELLKLNGFSTIECGDGEDGLFYLLNNTCDLVILDRMLPNIDGLSILRKLRAENIHTPVLMLTALSGINDRVTGLEAGADDYLPKPFDMRELSARVNALIRRPATIEQYNLISYKDVQYNASIYLLAGPNGEVNLSKRMGELFELLIRNAIVSQGRHISRATIFSRVWGPESDVEEKTIDTYISMLRKNLRQIGTKIVIHTHRGIGYNLH